MSRHAAPVPPQERLRSALISAVLLLSATATAVVIVGLPPHTVVVGQAVTSQGFTDHPAVAPGLSTLLPLPEGPPAPTGAVGEVVTPVSLHIPKIGVDTAVGPLGLNPDQTVQVPTDFDQAGWFELGPAPGQLGSAVILGHVDSYVGPAVFYRLGDLRPGDQVEVALTNHTVAHFAVTTVTTFPKDQFPAQAVYTPHGGTNLNLITCGGQFDTHTRSYLANVVVTTTLTALTTSTT